MTYFKTRTPLLSGTSYKEVSKSAKQFFNQLKGQSKRKIYVRSKYFKKQKVFFDYFWVHILEKREPDRIRRLKLLPCVIELIQKSSSKPTKKTNPQNQRETLFRFYGETTGQALFVVQIKQRIYGGALQCISCFPERS